jgi:ankyrin repeat protein
MAAVAYLEDALCRAVSNGNSAEVAHLLGATPEALTLRAKGSGWTLLHYAVRRLEIVGELIGRGIDVDIRDARDNAAAIHWAAAFGEVEVVRALADAGADVVGEGDSHQLGVMGWATCLRSDESKRAEVANLLAQRGVRHHLFSAIALRLPGELHRIVLEDPAAILRCQSRADGGRVCLQFALATGVPDMLPLLLSLGADPLARDACGHPVAAYAVAPEEDLCVMEQIVAVAAARGLDAQRPQGPALHLCALLACGEWRRARSLIARRAESLAADGGALHLAVRRNDAPAVEWLLRHGADPNGRWSYWGQPVTPLHVSAPHGKPDVVRTLLRAGADPFEASAKDGDDDAYAWACHYGNDAACDLMMREGIGARRPVAQPSRRSKDVRRAGQAPRCGGRSRP